MDTGNTVETKGNKKGKSKIVLIMFIALPLIIGAGIALHFYRMGANYLATENARVTTTLFHITPSMPGMLERFTIREGSYVNKNELLGWIEGGESFRSPVNGLVVRAIARQNQKVTPNEPIAVIADIHDLHIQANIEETYIARVQRGQSVIITIDALNGRRFTGYVNEIGRVTDAALTGQVMSFTTGGTVTKVTQLIPVKINITDAIDLCGLIGLNAAVRIRLSLSPNSHLSHDKNETDTNTAEPPGSITARGTVESAEKRSVYTTFGNIINRVYVEAGDRVTEGQVLAMLDTNDPALTIALQQTESALRSAGIELETARINHAGLTAMFEMGHIARLEFRQSEDALAHAQNNYDAALVVRNAALLDMERQLIKAPINGTVTAVYALEGAAGPGLLFVIEDTDNLKITARFREYDIGRIQTGMAVAINSDAPGNAVYSGTISRINPAAIKHENGETAAADVVEFEAEVTVTSVNTDLRIGMNTRLTILL